MADWVQANGHGPSGFDVPDAWDAFARGVLYSDWQRWQADFAPKALSTAEPGGGYLVPDELSAQVIDLMRSTTPIFQAGARVVPMTASTLDIARITGDPTAAWKAEAAAITASDVTLDRVRFTARTLPVLVKVTRELAEDAPNLGDVVKRAIGGAIGVEVTRVALRGSGTAPEPRGIRNQTGVTLTALGANGGPATHDVLIDEAKNVQLGNVTPNALIWHPRTSAALAKTKDTTNQYVPFPEALKDISRFPTTVLPTNIVKGTSTNATEIYTGAFSQLLIGMRTALRVELLRERFADSGEFAFLAWMRADVQLEHGAAFSVVTDVTN